MSTMNHSLSIRQMYKNTTHSTQDNTRQHNTTHSTDDVYQELEMFSNGQIIDIPLNEISELASLVSFSILSSNTIFRQVGSASGRVEYSFPVDSYTLQILIFVSGQNVNVTVLTPQGTCLH